MLFLVRHGGDAGRILDDVKRLTRKTLDCPQNRLLAMIAKRDGDSGRARSTRAADPMDVILHIDGQVEVDDV